MPPAFFIDQTLATVPIYRQGQTNWDDLMIAQLIGEGKRETSQSDADQWAMISRLFDKAGGAQIMV